MKAFLPPLLCLLLFAPFASADKVTLKDGRVFEGQILEENADGVKIKTAKATVHFTSDQVASVERGTSPLQERAERLSALDPEAPEKYAEFAEWMLAAPKEIQDEKIMRKVCSIAASLDPALACRAQLDLGKFYLARENKAEAATAFARALAADGENAEAKRLLAGLSEARAEVSRKQLQELRDAMQSVVDLKYAEAIPKLRKVAKYYFADKLGDYAKMSIEDLANDQQRRVPCKACGGHPIQECKVCGGTGLIKCLKCGGTGKSKKAATASNFAEEVCKFCYHMGANLCPACDATRTITAHWNKEVDGFSYLEITLHAHSEFKDLGRFISVSTWKRVRSDASVTAIDAGPVTGGKSICPVCKGIAFDPPDKDVNTFAIRDYMTAIDERLSGKVPIEAMGAAEDTFDVQEVFDHKYKWKDGKWTE